MNLILLLCKSIDGSTIVSSAETLHSKNVCAVNALTTLTKLPKEVFNILIAFFFTLIMKPEYYQVFLLFACASYCGNVCHHEFYN